MIVAGGIYSEACVAPASVALFGSGGRAALALTGLTPKVVLHAFQPARLADEVYPNFEPFGVEVRLYPSTDRVHFHYLHPLARPRISPVPLPTAAPVEVSGGEILLFGCLEGQFRATGGLVVYDPQTSVSPRPFKENGSSANRLAVVLNRAELAASSGKPSIDEGVQVVRERDGADVVIVKAGPDGAYVFDAGELVGTAPAYEASAIHKVGSGDTFSAAFAFYWMKGACSPLEAARLASLHTADYVETRRPTLNPLVADRKPMVRSANRSALVAIGRHGASAAWLVDETLSGLWDLGVRTRLYEGKPADAFEAVEEGETLLLLDPEPPVLDALAADPKRGSRVVVYSERLLVAQSGPARPSFKVETDLATALYTLAWAPEEAS